MTDQRHEKSGAVPTPADTVDWDAPITLHDAAAISGLAYNTLRSRAHTGDLRTTKVGARLHTTTRRWLDDFLRQRGTRGGGRGKPPKPLPSDYQAPPRRGRPRKEHLHVGQSGDTEREPGRREGHDVPSGPPHGAKGQSRDHGGAVAGTPEPR